jgi:hypothetical protein
VVFGEAEHQHQDLKGFDVRRGWRMCRDPSLDDGLIKLARKRFKDLMKERL